MCPVRLSLLLHLNATPPLLYNNCDSLFPPAPAPPPPPPEKLVAKTDLTASLSHGANGLQYYVRAFLEVKAPDPAH